MGYSFTLRTIYPYFGDLWQSALNTLSLSLLAIVLSIALGALVALMRRSALRPVRLLGLFRCVVYFIGHFINRHEDEEDDGGGGSGDGRGDGDCDGGDDRSRTL